MNCTIYEQAVFIDTSAAIELEDSCSQFHTAAHDFLKSLQDFLLLSVNATTHETYTRIRYDSGYDKAVRRYEWLRGPHVECITFTPEDEITARKDLERFRDHRLSYHDALLAAVMKRLGSYRIFAFDHHFWVFGFEVLPGITR